MIHTFSVTVPTPEGGEERTARVYVPEGEGRFPVIYLFDGQTAFSDETAPYGSALRIHEILKSLSVRAIVAAVDCSKTDRLSEYSPYPFRHGEFVSTGRGEATMQWLTQSFKPLVDGRFPTLADREHTVVMGSSMGGLMALYALSAFPAFFSAALAFSPSLWVTEDAYRVAAVPKNTEVYLDYGEKEYRVRKGISESLRRATELLFESGANFTFSLARGGEHNEKSWRERLPSALMTLTLLRKFSE